MATQHHETLNRPDDVPRASNRSVGLLFAVIFGLTGAWPLFGGDGPRIWALSVACGLVVLSLALPRALTPLAWAWLGLGHVLHLVVSPLILGLVYVVAVVPTGLYVKATGKDPLRLKRDPEAKSYWIERDPPGPDPKTLHQQF